MTNEELFEFYRSRAAFFVKEAERISSRVTLISFLRLAVFLGGIALSVYLFGIGVFPGIAAVIVSISVFLWLVKVHSKKSAEAEFMKRMAEININEAASVQGDYSAFDPGEELIDPSHNFSADIDLFGKSSMFQYLNRTVTGFGKSVLADWLSDPFKLASDLEKRQEAVRELAPMTEWRQQFIASGSGTTLGRENIESILSWLNDEKSGLSSKLARTIAWLLPLVTMGTLALSVFSVIPYQVFISFFLVNLIITSFNLRRTNRVHELLSGKYRFLSSLTGLLHHFEAREFSSSVLSGIKTSLVSGPVSAAKSIRKLSNLIRYFDSRLNVITGFLFNGLVLWDLHCLLALGRWKSANRKELPLWLKQCGEIEAWCSLANFAFNNPGFSYPAISVSGAVIDAKDLGHPLISAQVRVCNDFTISRNGTIVIITGANMAGKSTFLRTVAVNMIMAMTGAPVCASSFSFSAVNLFTSMRTTDSLSNNESYFYAELRRLKQLKEMVESDPANTFFILDEILKGTNSVDKSTGSRLFLLKLAENNATGLIATHDTSLGSLEKELQGRVFNRCFEIEIEGEKISFDYRLREGITTRMNAALLMREMGIA